MKPGHITCQRDMQCSNFLVYLNRHGCKHEKQARKQYEQVLKETHENLCVSDSGLWLNQQWPFMGASPDGMVVCSCHGTGVCEIKVCLVFLMQNSCQN